MAGHSGERVALPDHYCLLGLERFEEDREVIQQHANQRVVQLSKHKDGPYAKVCKELLYKVSVAKACLLNPSPGNPVTIGNSATS